MEAICSAAIFFMLVACVYGDPPLQATDVRMCDPKANYLFQINNIKLRVRDDAQELKLKAVLGKSLDDENNYVVSVDRLIGNKMKRILNLKNKGACSALVTYGGATFQGAIKQAKFPHPDKCPLEKGTFNLDWYRIDFDAIPLVKLVPKGTFQLNVQIFDSKTAKELACVIMKVDKN